MPIGFASNESPIASLEAAFAFSVEPRPSFGNTASDIIPTTTEGGSVLIVIARRVYTPMVMGPQSTNTARLTRLRHD